MPPTCCVPPAGPCTVNTDCCEYLADQSALGCVQSLGHCACVPLNYHCSYVDTAACCTGTCKDAGLGPGRGSCQS